MKALHLAIPLLVIATIAFVGVAHTQELGYQVATELPLKTDPSFTMFFNEFYKLTEDEKLRFAEELIWYGILGDVTPGESQKRVSLKLPKGYIAVWVWDGQISMCSIEPFYRKYVWLYQSSGQKFLEGNPPAFPEILKLASQLDVTKYRFNGNRDFGLRTQSRLSYLDNLAQCDKKLSSCMPDPLHIELIDVGDLPMLSPDYKYFNYIFLARDSMLSIYGCRLFSSGFFDMSEDELRAFPHTLKFRQLWPEAVE